MTPRNPEVISHRLIYLLNQFVAVYPASVNSFLRTQKRNIKAKGATYSKHLYGEAIDLEFDLWEPLYLEKAKYAISLGFGGVQVVCTKKYIHLDVRATPWHEIILPDGSIHDLDQYLTELEEKAILPIVT